MDYLRSIVEGYKTNKFKEDGFNLDFTYVTERIAAMSYPGSGLETIYRNNISDVARLLKKKHRGNYLVINLSEKMYDYTKFENKVKDFAWEDHHSPPINLLFTICEEIHKFLSSNIENVVVIHCLAGKGRTGTMIACYLLYSGRFDNYSQILQYYKKKRFTSGGGVTQSSQIRYVEYFDKVLNPYLETKKMHKPVMAVIEGIQMNGTPKFSSNGFKPLLKVYAVEQRKVIFTYRLPKQKIKKDDSDPVFNIKFPPENQPVIVGDVLLKFFHESSFSNAGKKAFRLAFNTSFCEIDANNRAVIKLGINQLDPNKVREDERFPINFSVEIFLRVLNMNVEAEESSSQPGYEIYEADYNEDAQRWTGIYNILDGYKKPGLAEAVQLLFKTPENDDVERVLNTKTTNKSKLDKINIQLSDSSPDQSQDEKSSEEFD